MGSGKMPAGSPTSAPGFAKAHPPPAGLGKPVGRPEGVKQLKYPGNQGGGSERSPKA